MPDPLQVPVEQDSASKADQQLVDTWAAAQGSALTRKSYRHQGGRLLARLGKPLAVATLADLQGFVACSTAPGSGGTSYAGSNGATSPAEAPIAVRPRYSARAGRLEP